MTRDQAALLAKWLGDRYRALQPGFSNEWCVGTDFDPPLSGNEIVGRVLDKLAAEGWSASVFCHSTREWHASCSRSLAEVETGSGLSRIQAVCELVRKLKEGE